jgi:CRP-like cAMP-binding protein
MNSKQVIETLKQVEILQELDEETYDVLVSRGTVLSLKKDEVLLTEGKIGETMFFVLEGELEIYREKVSVAFKRKFDFLGEMALIESHTRSASVKANEPTFLLVYVVKGMCAKVDIF